MELGFEVSPQQLPCAACRALHRKCSNECLLAPYFPSDQPEKFASVHKVFGASNVMKMLQMVHEEKRDDAAKSMVYEACARLRNPVYGCTNTISYLQKSVADLQQQVKLAKQEVFQSQMLRDRLFAFLMHAQNLNSLCYNTTSHVNANLSADMVQYYSHYDRFIAP